MVLLAVLTNHKAWYKLFGNLCLVWFLSSFKLLPSFDIFFTFFWFFFFLRWFIFVFGRRSRYFITWRGFVVGFQIPFVIFLYFTLLNLATFIPITFINCGHFYIVSLSLGRIGFNFKNERFFIKTFTYFFILQLVCEICWIHYVCFCIWLLRIYSGKIVNFSIIIDRHCFFMSLSFNLGKSLFSTADFFCSFSFFSYFFILNNAIIMKHFQNNFKQIADTVQVVLSFMLGFWNKLY